MATKRAAEIENYRGVLTSTEISETASFIDIGGPLLSGTPSLISGQDAFIHVYKQVIELHKEATERCERGSWSQADHRRSLAYMRDFMLCGLGVIFSLSDTVALANVRDYVKVPGSKVGEIQWRFDHTDIRRLGDDLNLSFNFLVPHRPGGYFYGTFGVDFERHEVGIESFWLDYTRGDDRGREQDNSANEPMINEKRKDFADLVNSCLTSENHDEWKRI